MSSRRSTSTKDAPPARRTSKKPAPRPTKTTAVTTELRPQPHGGALRNGGTNAGGLGAPPSLIRAGLRGSYHQRMSFLDAVADGNVMVQTEVPLAAIVPHIHCANCAYVVVPKDVADLFTLTIPGKTSPSVKDRLAAMDQMARYSIGALKEVSVDNVRERVAETLERIREHCTPELAEVLFRAIEPVWA